MSMTKEKAIDLAINEHDCKYSEELMDRIYHNFEAQLKARDERIKELEAEIDAYAEVQNQMTP